MTASHGTRPLLVRAFVAPDLELGAHPVLMSALGMSGSIGAGR
ncbi:hypothetical protein [Streptomyces sp. NBC_00353]